MIWVLLSIAVLIIIQIIIIGACFSNFRVNIKECKISYNIEQKNKFQIINLKARVDIFLFKKIKIFSVKIYKNYCEFLKIKFNFNILKKLKSDKESGISFVIRNIGKLEPEIKSLNLNIDVGTENVMLNIFIVPIISTILSGIISNYSNDNEHIKKHIDTNIKFEINPKFINKNFFNFDLSTIIYFDTITTLFFYKKHQEI